MAGGISSVPAQTAWLGHSALAWDSFILTWNILVAVVILTTTVLGIARSHPFWEAWRTLHAGMVALSCWYILSSIDKIIRIDGTQLTYGYIIAPTIFFFFRSISNLLVLAGIAFAMIRREHRHPEVHRISRVTIAVFSFLLFLTLYHTGLEFAVDKFWLSLAEPSKIQALARARNAFEITSAALQFLISGRMVFIALSEAKFNQRYGDMRWYISDACIYLFLRSFCEVVIVGQLDRDPRDLSGIRRARDVCYGLFNAAFALWVRKAIEQTRTNSDELEEKDVHLAKILENWSTTTRTRIVAEMEEKTNGGRYALPQEGDHSLQGILKRIRGEIGDNDAWKTQKTEEMDRQIELYEGWTSIQKTRAAI